MSFSIHKDAPGSMSSSVMSETGDLDDGEQSGGRETVKRKSRNLSEKKRRDQFNQLVNELSAMVSGRTRKMDKTTVLRATIAFLRKHNESCKQSQVHEIREDWKPSFLSNDEFTQLMLEAVDGYLMVISHSGTILYVSEGVTPLQSYLPSELINQSFYDFVYPPEKLEIYQEFASHQIQPMDDLADHEKDLNQLEFNCHFRCKTTKENDTIMYDPVKIQGHLRWAKSDSEKISSGEEVYFCCTVRLHSPKLLREVAIRQEGKHEFTSRHSLEWKFLFLDHRGPPIIGYLPFEVLGTSGYDYYHPEDLENISKSHEQLMQMGEGMSCNYRFLTKGQQWIWLQTRYFITYHQWSSKPEFVVCVHKVVSLVDALNQSEGGENMTTAECTSNPDAANDDESSRPKKLHMSVPSPSNSSVQSDRISYRLDLPKESNVAHGSHSMEEDMQMSMQHELMTHQPTHSIEDELQRDMHHELLSQPTHSIDEDLHLSMQHDLLNAQHAHSINTDLHLEMQHDLLTPQPHSLDDDLQQDMHNQLLSMIQPVASTTPSPQKELSSPSGNHNLTAVQSQSLSSPTVADLPTSSSNQLQMHGQFSSMDPSLQLPSTSSLNLSLLEPLVNQSNELDETDSLLTGMSPLKPRRSLDSASDFSTKSAMGQVVLTKQTSVPESAISSTNSSSLYVTPIQWKLHEQLQQKHRQLLAGIMKQQSELQQVSQQLLLLQQHSPGLQGTDPPLMVINQSSQQDSGNRVSYTVPTMPPHSSHVQTLDSTGNQVTYSVSPLSTQQSSPSLHLASQAAATAGSSHHVHNKQLQNLSPGGSASQLHLLPPQQAPPTANSLLAESAVNQTVFNPSIFLQSTQNDKPL